MAKGKKTGGRDWKRGQSGNPKGPNVMPKDLRALKEADREWITETLHKYLRMTWGEFQRIANDPSLSMLEVYLANILNAGLSDGDERRMNFILDRYIGKVKDKVEHSGEMTLEQLVAGRAKDRDDDEGE
jgi:hypothetical protein